MRSAPVQEADQGRSRAQNGAAPSVKRGDEPCRLLQSALQVAFRRASAPSGGSTVSHYTPFAARRRIRRAERATQARMECEKYGLSKVDMTFLP
jgi:hypothetical protein